MVGELIILRRERRVFGFDSKRSHPRKHAIAARPTSDRPLAARNIRRGHVLAKLAAGNLTSEETGISYGAEV